MLHAAVADPSMIILCLFLLLLLLPPLLLQTLEAAMDELQRKNLIPLQKESFLCAAKCCDKHSDMQALQQW
jgi:hypothetical protein